MSDPPLPAAIQHPAPDTAHATICENCGAALGGHYCHQCGQSAHNPLHSFAHAMEEVFESFWHLDGRIFRTLRELFLPGKVARGYLAGHRVRYIPPLRLFVILSLLTFFVGKLTLHVGMDPSGPGPEAAIARAQTVAEVQRIRDGLIAPIDQAEQSRTTPGVDGSLIAARIRIESATATRLARLRERARAPDAATAKDPPPAATGAATPTRNAAELAKANKAIADGALPFECQFNDRKWNAQDNPVTVGWLPAFANAWINDRIGKGCENAHQMRARSEHIFQQFLGAIPTALFVLIPFFALLLKLLYLGTGRTYLEHLVVALYSHGFLLLMLLALFVLSALANAGVTGWVTGMGQAAVWIWTPIYLLLMQKRVYAGGWPLTLLRYTVIGMIYLVLVVLVMFYAAFVGISS